MGRYWSLLPVLLAFGCCLVASEQDITSFNPADINREVPRDNGTTQQHEIPIPVADPESAQPPVTGGEWTGRYGGNAREGYPPIFVPVPGPAGQPGYPGPTGATGPSGMPGNHGNNGNNGMPGSSGPMGTKGSKGEQGYPGLSGSPGVPGSTGASGPQGPQGHDGGMGTPGHAGKHGLPGSAGNPGESGMPGVEGQKGAKGEEGLPGIPGIRGQSGECNCDTVQRYGTRTSAFSVARTSALTATDGPVTVTFQHVFTNVGDDFNVDSGKFNCSIPGLYFFSINVYKSSTTNFPLVQLLHNGEHIAAVIDYGSTDTEDSASNTVIISLSVGDLVWLQLYDGRELYSSHYRFTTFSGFRIA